MLLSVRRGRQAGGQARQAWSISGWRSRAGSPRMGGSCGGGAFSWLREGWAQRMTRSQARSGWTAERVRQIVRGGARAAHHRRRRGARQTAIGPPSAGDMRLAGAIADGDVTAIAPLMKVLDRLDRYQRAAKAVQVYDDEARSKLMDKINHVAANLGVDEARAAAKAAGSGDSGALGRRGGGARRRGWGGLRRKPRQGSAKPLKRLDSDKEMAMISLTPQARNAVVASPRRRCCRDWRARRIETESENRQDRNGHLTRASLNE